VAGDGEIRLRDGRTVRLRVAAPADVPRIARLYAELSAQSFLSRFQSAGRAPGLLARLARIDVVPGTTCLIATVAPESAPLAAEARYVPTAEDVGELALTVRDDFQGAGLGCLLLSALIEHARGSGIERLSAVVSLTNGPMLHLLARYGWAQTQSADECMVACLEISAIGGMPGWPSAAAGQRILVERRGWFDDGRIAALRAAGNHIRQCPGPGQRSGRTCPLISSGRCRLAEDADRILTLLPSDDQDCVAVARAHRQLWPGKLAQQPSIACSSS
jgi:L-amino acid N-acyltransferase YncA